MPTRTHGRIDRHAEAGGEKAVRKYLAQHAEPEAANATRLFPLERRVGHVLCIPAQGEGEDLLSALDSVPEGPSGDVLIILIVNECRLSADWIRRANRESLATVRAGSRTIATDDILQWRTHRRGSLLLIDRTESGLPLPGKQGVGLARKIAADVALALWAEGHIEAPWIHCSDADVRFPTDYFRQPAMACEARGPAPLPAAWVYDFRHVLEPDEQIARAALRYEIFLRYYVLGLRSAGSPYAFQTIGSTLALSPVSYAQARGFPRRQAGEDFHLLAKLAKLGPVDSLRGDPILLSGRVSKRVPFGTGAGIASEIERARAGRFYPAYDPRVFLWLGIWLRTLDSIGGGNDDGQGSVSDSLSSLAETAPEVDGAALQDLLESIGAIAAAEAGRHRGRRHLHERFDALRTLRFIHALRDDRFPSVPLETALERAHFLPRTGVSEGVGLAETCGALASLEAAPIDDAADA